ncbi:MAG: Fe-S cluster assembly sulfur transfer protein SufU [Bacteroidota bacterium]
MKKEELRQLFKEKILPHQRSPYHFESISSPSEEVLAYNPFCGDKFTLQLQKEGEDIDKAYFQGFGCAISQASTSILLQRIEGKTKREIINYLKMFLENLEHGTLTDDEELNVLIHLNSFDGREDCITLAWKVLLEHWNQ